MLTESQETLLDGILRSVADVRDADPSIVVESEIGLAVRTIKWLALRLKETHTDYKESIKLLEYALHLRMYGENAPGGNETWKEFDTKCEEFLRKVKT